MTFLPGLNTALESGLDQFSPPITTLKFPFGEYIVTGLELLLETPRERHDDRTGAELHVDRSIEGGSTNGDTGEGGKEESVLEAPEMFPEKFLGSNLELQNEL